MPSLRPLKRMFSGDKTLESPVLNRMGAQVIRAVMARALYNARRTAADEAIRDHVETLSRDGMLMIPNFLGEEQFDKVRREAAVLLEGPNKVHLQHGPNRMEQVVLDEVAAHRLSRDRRVLPRSAAGGHHVRRRKAATRCHERQPRAGVLNPRSGRRPRSGI